MTTPMTIKVVPIVGGPPGGPGVKGDNGNNLRIDNVVSTASALPATPPEGENAVYSVADENALYMWTSVGGWVKAADLQGTPGAGVPTGGATGQTLTKASGADLDVEWATPITEADIADTVRTVGPTDVTGLWLGTDTQYGALTPEPSVAYLATDSASSQKAKLYIGARMVAGGGGSSTVVDHGTTHGAITLDASAGSAHVLTLDGAATITLAGISGAGELHEVRLFLSAKGKAVTWPAAVTWVGSAPILRGEVDEISLTTTNGGSTVLAVHVGRFGSYTADVPPLPAAIGDAYMGGYFAGIMDTTKGNIIASDASQTGLRYALVVGPKTMQRNSIAYKLTADAAVPESHTRWDGLTATLAMNSSTYPAAQWCAGQPYDDTDGGSQWYLPALDELELLYRNLKPTTEANYTTSDTGNLFPGATQDMGYNPSSDPAGPRYISGNPAQTTVAAFKTGAAQSMGTTSQNFYYWSATEYNVTDAWNQFFSNSTAGAQNPFTKTLANTAVYARPVRRIIL